MSNAPLIRGGSVYEIAGRTNVATGAADAWGSWVQLIASIARPVEAVNVGWRTANMVRSVLQIGIGGSGSEIDILTITLFTEQNSSTVLVLLQQPLGLIPVRIPAGSRVSVRIKTSQASHTHVVDLQGVTASPLLPVGFSRMEVYGIIAGPLGTAMNRGSGTNYGSWVEFVASTTNRVRALAIGLSTARNGEPVLTQVGVGPGGSEQPLFSSACQPRWADWPVGGMATVMPVDIPAGSRLAMRVSSHLGGSNPFDGVLHVFY